MAMKIIYRITLALALFNALSTAAVAFVYYVVARPEWSDTAAWGQVEATLRDPGTSAAEKSAVKIASSASREPVANTMAISHKRYPAPRYVEVAEGEACIGVISDKCC